MISLVARKTTVYSLNVTKTKRRLPGKLERDPIRKIFDLLKEYVIFNVCFFCYLMKIPTFRKHSSAEFAYQKIPWTRANSCLLMFGDCGCPQNTIPMLEGSCFPQRKHFSHPRVWLLGRPLGILWLCLVPVFLINIPFQFTGAWMLH